MTMDTYEILEPFLKVCEFFSNNVENPRESVQLLDGFRSLRGREF
jgi:hypothetical protein